MCKLLAPGLQSRIITLVLSHLTYQVYVQDFLGLGFFFFVVVVGELAGY
jgi:hypothetical protein